VFRRLVVVHGIQRLPPGCCHVCERDWQTERVLPARMSQVKPQETTFKNSLKLSVLLFNSGAQRQAVTHFGGILAH
jgi:hypothetical protein